MRQLDSDPLAPIKGAQSTDRRTQTLLDHRLAALLDAPNTGLRIKRDPQLITNFLAQGMDILLDAESLLRAGSNTPASARNSARCWMN